LPKGCLHHARSGSLPVTQTIAFEHIQGISRNDIMKKHMQRSSSSLHQTIFGLSIGVAGFFAGSLYTMHMGIGQHHAHNVVQQVEEAVQRRMQGTDHYVVYVATVAPKMLRSPLLSPLPIDFT
jgi:hypothetical protein